MRNVSRSVVEFLTKLKHQISLSKKGNDLCVCVICVPRRPQRLLATDVPHEKVCIVHNNLFHVASDCWGGVDHLIHGAKNQSKNMVK